MRVRAIEGRRFNADDVAGVGRHFIGARDRGERGGSDAGLENIFGRIVVEDDELVGDDRNVARDDLGGVRFDAAAHVFEHFEAAGERGHRLLHGGERDGGLVGRLFHAALHVLQHVVEFGLVGAATVGQARFEAAHGVHVLRLEALNRAGDLFADLADGFGAAAFALAHALVEAVGEAIDFGAVEWPRFERGLGDAVGEALDAFVVAALQAFGDEGDLFAHRVDGAGAAGFEPGHAIVDGCAQFCERFRRFLA